MGAPVCANHYSTEHGTGQMTAPATGRKRKRKRKKHGRRHNMLTIEIWGRAKKIQILKIK